MPISPKAFAAVPRPLRNEIQHPSLVNKTRFIEGKAVCFLRYCSNAAVAMCQSTQVDGRVDRYTIGIQCSLITN